MSAADLAFTAVSPGVEAATLDLRATTSLASCTDVDSKPGLRLVITRRDHPLSDGEALLWDVLCWLSGGCDLPSARELDAWLDADNYEAVRQVLATEGTHLPARAVAS